MVTYGKRRLLAAFALTTVGAVVLAGCSGSSEPETEESSGPVTLTLTTNSITGGKNAAEADWIADWVIPEFEKAMEEDGKDVTVEFQPQGVDDEDYKTKIALDLQSGKGADIIGMDGIWVGEFAEAGYIKPLAEVGGSAVDDWDGWAQIPDAVQNALSFDGERYGVPQGADGRVLYYNKDLFVQAGLDEDWAPESWDDILDAAGDLKKLDGVTPIQLNAGTAMGEATTMQGLLPMLVGTGEQVFEDGKWIGATDGMEEVLDLYKTIYVDEGLGDPVLQQEASGRDTSFQLFAEGKIGILLEGDYFWRSVINPAEGVGTAPMADRDDVVGYAKIPAIEPGEGIDGQDYVSMSGGTGRVLNPNSKHAELAWELLAFMNSPEAYEARAAGTLAISPRNDVNEKLLSSDPMLTFVSEEVLPITAYRPGLAAYPQVSVLLQQATLDVATGTSVDDTLKTYVRGLEGVVGPDSISE
ncbi:extracellular solute-binding protein [Microbacterium sp. Se5.02b]|uniref:extracellular solute-binding protein n=1 Tax=Microbacterium sp. Se5.02b TaxID=2864103 RepID=UPI001C68F36B|nr:extracellular solute-binding protein [Microbacterium sp. Se5.02b]QYM64033.1 extracellular solute-binding protein [Microbacterium sp. Se5.02b]